MGEMSEQKCDVVIVGAGFAGLYLLHRLRGLGFSTRVFETGSGVGGTWYWNRYPGARCDVESMQYSYSFSEELEQEWWWPEKFSAQPDILAYANHVADRFDLRRDIDFDTTVTSAHFDEGKRRWAMETATGEQISARFCIMATGCISTAQTPDFEGLSNYKGATYHTGNWPHDGVDFTGQRIAVIGTGSSGIQAIPVLAEQADHVTVFQRTPNYSLPTQNQPMTAEYAQSWKDNYPALREEQRHTGKGSIRDLNDESALAVSAEDRDAMYTKRWAVGGTGFLSAYNDLIFSREANETAAEFVRNQIRATVRDPQVAERLVAKDYPIGAKRICVDSGYFETYNRDNVALVDISEAPIERITDSGLVVQDQSFDFDAIVFATGFDAMTGTLFKIDIQGRAGAELRTKWDAGPRTYLGLMCESFPNMFMITGPGSPSVLSNMIVSIEQHVDLVTDTLVHMRDRNLVVMEPTLEAEDDWVEEVNAAAYKTVYPAAASWYMGANIPGKPRIFMPYIGGVGVYRKICEKMVADGYKGFRFESDANAAAAE
ncbi:MAG: NAD(P)/FAD-dependent oxidoreductase [Rhodospirillaceae bacterium]|nr:NAD(P)/FAD-dependent oxidoreductase [Rhodospirillaceae bacterium]MBT5664239.1 NAD(P)/FAD-dependent oxidoreductase [Rhodospirillaceae bacterium]